MIQLKKNLFKKNVKGKNLSQLKLSLLTSHLQYEIGIKI